MSAPELVYAHATLPSSSGRRLIDATPILSGDVADLVANGDAVDAAVAALVANGFAVLQRSPLSLAIAAPRAHLDAVLPPSLDDAPSFDWARPTAGTPLAGVVDDVVLSLPTPELASAVAPIPGYWALSLGELADALGAARPLTAQPGGAELDGTGTRVVMIDSGWFPHPYFDAIGVSRTVVLGPGAAEPDADERGHGTSMVATLLSVAPNTQVTLVKYDTCNAAGALARAIDEAPDVIACCLGADRVNSLGPFVTLEAEVARAVQQGIVVVAAGGNNRAFAFPAQHPEVVSVGGVWMSEDRRLRVSSNSSYFASVIYPGRNVPDVCGLGGVGYWNTQFMAPTAPGSASDVDRASFDTTAAADGWTLSGATSAACAQVAGVCLLLRQARPDLNAAAVRALLEATANPAIDDTSVVDGVCKTGAGLVDARAAVAAALAMA